MSLCKWSDLLEMIQSLRSSSSYLPTHTDSQDILRTSYILDTSWSWFSFIEFWFPLDPYFWEIDFSFTGRRRSPRQAYIWRPTQGGVHRFTKYFDDTSWSWTSFIGFGFPLDPDFLTQNPQLTLPERGTLSASSILLLQILWGRKNGRRAGQLVGNLQES